jgi:hypothetical protein
MLPEHSDSMVTPASQFVNDDGMNVSTENLFQTLDTNLLRELFPIVASMNETNVCVQCSYLFDIPQGFCNPENHKH